MSEETINFVAQLYEVKTRADGGSRIVIECGADALEAIQKLVKLNGTGDVNLAVAVCPFVEK